MKNKLNRGVYLSFLKRPMDLIFSLIAIILLSPVFLVVSILVRMKLGSPIFFKQQRPGLNERIFTIYKFRTMTDVFDEHGVLLPDSERLTRFGIFLRSTSIDELPELFNIVRGDMSIVGPRPLLMEYLSLYSNEQRLRHIVRPGLTGLAQINGRNLLIWDERFRMDQLYVNSVSFIVDLKIVFKTIKKTMIREGIHSESSETMETFKGSIL